METFFQGGRIFFKIGMVTYLGRPPPPPPTVTHVRGKFQVHLDNSSNDIRIFKSVHNTTMTSINVFST